MSHVPIPPSEDPLGGCKGIIFSAAFTGLLSLVGLVIYFLCRN